VVIAIIVLMDTARDHDLLLLGQWRSWLYAGLLKLLGLYHS
jgi:hypothetical protein